MKNERRYLCAYFPEWSIQITKRSLKFRGLDNQVAVLLTSTVANHLVVTRYCAAAAHAGVRLGMALPLALALSPGAHVEQFDPIRDCRALYKLAVRCLQFSPLVGLDHELFVGRSQGPLEEVSPLHYGITIDLTGTERLHGDIHTFALNLHSFFKGKAAIAVAPTLGAAWGLSRYSVSGAPRIVHSQRDVTAALSPLPVVALRIPPVAATSLRDVGITRIGDLLHLPRYTLTQRFGKFVSYRLEQALGDLEERLHTVEETKRYNASKIFEPPLTNRKSIVISMYNLFEHVISQLKRNKRSAKSFHLIIQDTAKTTIQREFPLASATDDLKHLTTIIEPIIDGMNFSGEIREIAVTARNIEATRSEQKSLSPTPHKDSPDSREKKELLNTFSVRIGKERLLVAKLNQSYIPERSFSYQNAPDAMSSASVHQPIPHYSLEERPSYLLPRPEEITTLAMLPDKPPSFIQWRGKKLKIVTGIGPERISPEWWGAHLAQGEGITRDYFKVQDECGRWLWVYRDLATQTWFLHGMWI
jgi:protein ImuB